MSKFLQGINYQEYLNLFDKFLSKWMTVFGVENIILQRSLFLLIVLISVKFIFNLWFHHRQDVWPKKMFWTLILSVPFIGWLFYAGFYNPPERQPEHLQAKTRSGISGGMYGGGN